MSSLTIAGCSAEPPSEFAHAQLGFLPRISLMPLSALQVGHLQAAGGAGADLVLALLRQRQLRKLPPLHARPAALSALLRLLSTEGPTSCQHS